MPGHYKALGPLSLNGVAKESRQETDQQEVQLQVLSQVQPCGTAKVHPAYLPEVEQSNGMVFMELASGSDSIVCVCGAEDVRPGTICLTEAQQYNLRVLPGDQHWFRVFSPLPKEPFDLVECDVEVMAGRRQNDVVQGRGDKEPLQVSCRLLLQEFLKAYLGVVVAVNDYLPLICCGEEVLLRVTRCDTLVAEEREEVIGYHCYRGRLTPDTAVFPYTEAAPECSRKSTYEAFAFEGKAPDALHVEPDGTQTVAAGGGTMTLIAPQTRCLHRRGIVLLDVPCRLRSHPTRASIKILTSDGEWFPVQRKLLRPAIQLTQHLRNKGEEEVTVSVDVDTLTFDRVLIFLEAEALGRTLPSFALHHVEDLLKAGQTLGIKSLIDYCQDRLGAQSQRQKMYKLDEVKALNARGEVWLILDGMVLDVTRWLPEHPGGEKIIPTQALNMDCARFFEIYHATRESFMYLKEFYMGELDPTERGQVPHGKEPPSQDFLTQLRAFTQFRMKSDELQKSFKSF